MVIKNTSKGKILSETAIKAETYKQKAFGLLLFKKPTAMVFKTRFGIHTFFMKYPIDVLILDKENIVVAMKENLKPNRIYVWNFRYETVIELPTTIIQKTSLKIGDQISFNS